MITNIFFPKLPFYPPFKFRFFTPNNEVDLCGHATIATFTRLKEVGRINKNLVTQETKAGILPVEFIGELVFMDQNKSTYRNPNISLEELSESLNIDEEHIENTKLPIKIVSTGLEDLLIPIDSLSTIKSIRPNFELIRRISKKLGITGYHLFTFETIEENSTAHIRNFAPLYDIDEESATGTSNCALGCYLIKEGILKDMKKYKMVFEQGYEMNRPSKIIVEIEVNEKKDIERVRVGGKAILVSERTIEI